MPPPPSLSGAPLPPPPRTSGTLPPPPAAPGTLPTPKANGIGAGAAWPAWGEEEDEVRKPLPKTNTSGGRPAGGRPGGPAGATPNWPSWSEEEDEPARPAARGKSGGGPSWSEDDQKPARSVTASGSMPAWADQGEQQEGWLGGAVSPASASAKGGLAPASMAPPKEATETTAGAAVWESDGLMGSATIPVDDSDILPSMREPEANNTKMLVLAIGLLLAVVCGLGFMLTRPAEKPKTPTASDVLQPSELMARARAAAEKKNFKGASLEAESAVAILEVKPDAKKELIDAQKFLASMYIKNGEHERAYKVYKQLHNETGDKKFAAQAQEAEKLRLKAIRGQAAEKLKLAKNFLAKNDPGSAIMEGLHAEQLYNDGKGTNAQKASVCVTVGRAFEMQGANDRAEEYYKKAVNLDPNGGYYSYLSNVRAKTAAASAPVSTYVEPEPDEFEVPTGTAPRRTPRRTTPRPQAKPQYTAQPQPKPQQKPAPAPIRRTPKKSGPNTFKSDNDPTRFKYY